MRQSDPVAEGARILTVCNACRYCQGYCAVFPAMERLRDFPEPDLHYLANLCHNCAECYYACQYAPPHEFAVNVPQVLAQIRLRSYETHAWRGPARPWVAWTVALAALLGGLTLATPAGGADFYRVIPHGALVGIFGVVAALVLVALAAGTIRFWRRVRPVRQAGAGAALWRTVRDGMSLKYLSSGGAGCTYPDQRHSPARRWFHHFTFYGFLLCFASTCVAAFYHYGLGWRAPYGYFSLPVVLGTLGGAGLVIGPGGLYALKARRDAAIADASQDPIDRSFLVLLFATGVTGLVLLALRESRAMPALLVLHLAIVMGLFVSLPYGKFVHGIYRAAALLRNALEENGSREPHGAGKG